MIEFADEEQDTGISVDALCSYLPASIVGHLHAARKTPDPPISISFETVVLFADVSGFTKLSESLSSLGPSGAEHLARHLNSYFEQLLRIIGTQGGDVFKFAGDAMIVVWPKSDEDIPVLIRRATQASIEIQNTLHAAELRPGVVLSVKLGIGVGVVSVCHLGGVLDRLEYLLVGDPLVQAFSAEHKAEGGDLILSPKAWAMVEEFFVPKKLEDGYAFIDVAAKTKDAIRKINIFKSLNLDINANSRSLIASVMKYVPGAVMPFLKADEERWASDLRRVAVIFINLGLTDADMAAISTVTEGDQVGLEAVDKVQKVISVVQTAVYRFEGSLNKFLMDDKGSTLLAVFGLPPLAHEDDSVRAVLTSLTIRNQLSELGLRCSIGVTTGTAFCGVVGGRVRREYSVLGDSVNLSARLMQYAKETHNGGVIVDSATQYSARKMLCFNSLGTIEVKGKTRPVDIFAPSDAEEKLYSKLNVNLYRNAELVPPVFVNTQVMAIGRGTSVDSPVTRMRQQESETEYAGSPIRGPKVVLEFKVHMPQKMGYVSVKAVDVENLFQVKDHVFAQMRRRAMMQAIGRDGFSLRVKGTDLLFTDESLSIEVIIPMLSSVCHDLSVVELELVAMSSESPDFIVPRPDYHYVNCEVVAASISRLLLKRRGMTLVVQGDIGVGKTHMLKQAFFNIPALSTMYIEANPFERISSPFEQAKDSCTPSGVMAIWREFFLRLIDSDIAVKSRGKSGQLDVKHARKEWVAQWAESASLHSSISCLNDIFGLGIEESEENSVLSCERRLEISADILVSLLKSLATEPYALIVDDATFMDEASWMMAEKVTKEVVKSFPILLVISTRPITSSYMGMFHIPIPKEYTSLTSTEVPIAKLITVEPLSDCLMYSVACSILKVADLPPTLCQMLLNRSRGNPLVIKELMYSLKRKKLIYINADGDCAISDELNDLHAVDVPISLQSTLGARIDRLSPVQVMILKTVSLLGREFIYSALTEVYPIQAHADSLAKELAGLCSLNILQKVNDFTAIDVISESGAVEEDTYFPGTAFVFVESMMRDVVKSRILDKQKQLLQRTISELDEATIAEKHSLVGETHIAVLQADLEQTYIITEGRFEIRKDDSESKKLFGKSMWKHRYSMLRETAFVTYYAKDTLRMTGVVFLENASTSICPFDEVGRANVVRIEAFIWIKKGILFRTRRYFYIAFETLEEARNFSFKFMEQVNKLISSKGDLKRRSRRASELESPAREFSSGDGRGLFHRRGRSSSVDNIPPVSPKSSPSRPHKRLFSSSSSSQGSAPLPIISDDEVKELIASWTLTDPEEVGVRGPKKIVHEGWLNVMKSKGSISPWKRRWVVVTQDSMLLFHTHTEDMPLEAICLFRARLTPKINQKEKVFEVLSMIHTKGSDLNTTARVFRFEAASKSETNDWLNKIGTEIGLCCNFIGGSAQNSAKVKLNGSLEELRHAVQQLKLGSKGDSILEQIVNLQGFVSSDSFEFGQADSMTKILTNSDLDVNTKTWLREEYTRENGPKRNSKDLPSQLKVPRTPDSRVFGIDAAKLSVIDDWDFDAFSFNEDELLDIPAFIWNRLGFLEHFGISTEVCKSFVLKVSESYLDNPYHNFYHAVDVMQTMYSILVSFRLKSKFSKLESFSMLLAALVHDIRHPGLNNAFQVNARTPLAMLYNDQSVLEHHHASSTFRILNESTTALLGGLSNEDYRTARKILVGCIIATDMSNHFNLVQKMTEFSESPAKDDFMVNELKDADFKHRAMVMESFLHAADISNPCKTWKVSKCWSDTILDEFFRQGDLEKSNNLPVSMGCDRSTTIQSQFSLNFIDFIVSPQYIALCDFAVEFSIAVQRLLENRDHWHEICVSEIEEDKLVPEAEKEELIGKWERRRESFNSIVVPALAAASPARLTKRKSSATIMQSFIRQSTS